MKKKKLNCEVWSVCYTSVLVSEGGEGERKGRRSGRGRMGKKRRKRSEEEEARRKEEDKKERVRWRRGAGWKGRGEKGTD